MNSTELPAVRKERARGKKRLWPAALAIIAVTVTGALTAAAAGPASAAVQATAQAAAIKPAVSDVTAASLKATAKYVKLTDGRIVFDSAAALKAGVSSQAVNTEKAVVASTNKVLGSEVPASDKDSDPVTAAVTNSNGSVTVNGATALSDAGVQASSFTISILQGITIEVNSTGVYITMTAAAVTEFKDVTAEASDAAKVAIAVGDVALAVVAAITAAVLAVPTPAVAPAVAAATIAIVVAIWNGIGVGVEAALDFSSQVVSLCAGSGGSAEFAITLAPPFLSCS